MSEPSPEVAMEYARKFRWRCAICGKRIRAHRQQWVTRITDMRPCHLLCALDDPRVVKVTKTPV